MKWVEQASPAIKRVEQASPAIKRVAQVSPVRQDRKRKKVKVEPEDESVLTVDDSSSQVDTEEGSVGSSTSIFCTKCDEIFQTVDELVSHEKTCYKGCRYPCTWPECAHINSQKSLLCQHVKGVHEKNPYRCSLCPDQTFIYKSRMTNTLSDTMMLKLISSTNVQSATLSVTTRQNTLFIWIVTAI